MITKILNQVEGDWERVSCHGNQFLYSQRCVTKFQCPLLQIDRDSSTCIQTLQISPEPYLQVKLSGVSVKSVSFMFRRAWT